MAIVLYSDSLRLTVWYRTNTLEGYAMAHREQHGNRETKKPRKEKPKDEAQSTTKWAVSDRLASKVDAKH
jgi:hypothetical protein